MGNNLLLQLAIVTADIFAVLQLWLKSGGSISLHRPWSKAAGVTIVPDVQPFQEPPAILSGPLRALLRRKGTSLSFTQPAPAGPLQIWGDQSFPLQWNSRP